MIPFAENFVSVYTILYWNIYWKIFYINCVKRLCVFVCVHTCLLVYSHKWFHNEYSFNTPPKQFFSAFLLISIKFSKKFLLILYYGGCACVDGSLIVFFPYLVNCYALKQLHAPIQCSNHWNSCMLQSICSTHWNSCMLQSLKHLHAPIHITPITETVAFANVWSVP